MNQPKNDWQHNEVYKVLQSHCIASGADKRTLPHFIQTLLHSQAREVCESLEGMKRKIPQQQGKWMPMDDKNDGYNQALFQAIERIKKEWY